MQRKLENKRNKTFFFSILCKIILNNYWDRKFFVSFALNIKRIRLDIKNIFWNLKKLIFLFKFFPSYPFFRESENMDNREKVIEIFLKNFILRNFIFMNSYKQKLLYPYFLTSSKNTDKKRLRPSGVIRLIF